ncbi:unnamed protein product [Dicrocoelium dendriticum]|nr:unnamed protein product [Dicrocoelium dendriticum]
MHIERNLRDEIAKFKKLCKERQQKLLSFYERKEQRINDCHKNNLRALHRKHRKHATRLQGRLDNKKKGLQRELAHDTRIELKVYRRHFGQRATSTDGVDANQVSGTHSTRSLDSTPTIEPLSSATPFYKDSIKHEPHWKSPLHRPGWNFRHTKRKPDDLSTNFSKDDCLEDAVVRLRKEMEERLRYADEEKRLAVARLEWEFLTERYELKRDYLEKLAEFKQRRLSALGQLKKRQLKEYFDILRKWLVEQHARELSARHQFSQDVLKRLTSAQTVERRVACRLARITSKGQRQITHVMHSTASKEERLEPKQQLSGRKESSSQGKNPPADQSLFEILFPKSANDRTENDVTSLSSRHSNHISSMHSSLECRHREAEPKTRSLQSSTELLDNDTTNTRLLSSKAKGPSLKVTRGRRQRQLGVWKSKSLQSLRSALETCDQMHRDLINNLSKQQVEQWAEVLNQERILTEALIQSQTEQKRILLQEETDTLKRAQVEQANRVAHLSSVLEATEKFAEMEYHHERKKLIEYYYGNGDEQFQSFRSSALKELAPEFATSIANHNTPMPSSSLQSTVVNNNPHERKPISSIGQNSSRSGALSTRGHVTIYHESGLH